MNTWQYLLVNNPEGEIGPDTATPSLSPSGSREEKMAAAIDLMRRNQAALKRVKSVETIRSIDDLRRRAQDEEMERRVQERMKERKKISEEM